MKRTANAVRAAAPAATEEDPRSENGEVAATRTRKRLSRVELTPLAREALFRAAAKVVGEVGYAGASVARITSAAGVAQGTFYLYFDTRQSLFDELLSHARGEMLALVRERMGAARGFFEREARGMAAFLEYLRREPGFIRVLNEAEAVAPEAYRSHYEDIAHRYRRLLARAVANGEIRRLGAGELETVVYLIMGSRVALYQRCRGQPESQADAAVKHYMKMIEAWLAP